MKFNSTIFAVLLGLSVLGTPMVASARRIPNYRRAQVSAWFHSVRPARRQRFLSNHPYLAQHRWLLNHPGAWQNRGNNGRAYSTRQWGANPALPGIYNGQEPDGDEYGCAQPPWRHRELERENFRRVCNGDGDADDCGGAAYNYQSPGYAYGNHYYGNQYPAYGSAGFLPMIQQFVP
jgi:hypothetical protein